jgi:hypothetical protein
MNAKNVKARRGNMAAAKGPSIARERIQTNVCFAGYFLPSDNVSDWKDGREGGRHTVYPMFVKPDSKRFGLQISINSKQIVFTHDASEPESEERVQPPEKTPRVQPAGSLRGRVCIGC